MLNYFRIPGVSIYIFSICYESDARIDKKNFSDNFGVMLNRIGSEYQNYFFPP